LHIGSEATARVRHSRGRDRADERVEQARACFGRRRAREARPEAAARVGGQSELRYEQQGAADVADRPIHPAGGVRKNSVRHESRSEPFGLLGPIMALDSGQYEQPYPNFGDLFGSNGDTGPTYALYQPDHL
jgi:hypothetical protein